MILYVVRHGETQFNVEKRYAGQKDVPLNERGLSFEAMHDFLLGNCEVVKYES